MTNEASRDSGPPDDSDVPATGDVPDSGDVAAGGGAVRRSRATTGGGVVRVVIAVVGLGAIGWGAYGVLVDDRPDIIGIGMFMIAALVAHDFVVLPASIAVSALVMRFAPRWARTPAQAALVVSAAVSVVALPLVLGKGRIADNPSAFPQHYGRGLLLILGVVWTAAVVWAAVNRRGSPDKGSRPRAHR